MVLFVTALSDARSERALSAPIKFDAKTESVRGHLRARGTRASFRRTGVSSRGVGEDSNGSLRHAFIGSLVHRVSRSGPRTFRCRTSPNLPQHDGKHIWQYEAARYFDLDQL